MDFWLLILFEDSEKLLQGIHYCAPLIGRGLKSSGYFQNAKESGLFEIAV